MESCTKQWPKVMSSHHRGNPCGPCVLCKKNQPRYDHFCTLTTTEQAFVKQHFGSEIASNSCICRSHSVEAKRHRSDPEYIPAWKQSTHKSHTTVTCMYPGCSITCSPFGERIITPSREVLPLFAEVLNVDGNVSVCETHYQTIYRQTHKLNPCTGCGAKPKVRHGAFTRHSPNAVIVSEYLQTRTESDPDLSPTDTLCKGCYDMHLVILKHIDQQARERDLKSDIALWKYKMTDENTDELTRAILATVIFVAEKLQQERALLLPQAVTVFLGNYPSPEQDLELELEYGKVHFSPRWLLITYLQPFMNFKCIIRRIGTLLYPQNSDPLKCLTLCLNDTNSYPDSVLQLKNNPVMHMY